MNQNRVLEAGVLTLFFLIILGLETYLYADNFTWRGGPARRSALGGISIAMPDASSVIDLYSEGFASSLVLRDKTALIGLSLSAIPHESFEKTGQSYKSLKDHPITFISEGDSSAGITYFFDDDSAISVKPYIMLNEGAKQMESGPPSDSSGASFLENLYALDIVFSRRINDYFSGGASLRAAFYRDEVVTGRFAYVNYDSVEIDSSDKILYSKSEYSLSGTYSPDEKTMAAVSIGALKNLNPYYEPWITGMKKAGFEGAIAAYPVLFAGYSYTRTARNYTFASLWEGENKINEKTNVSGFDVNAGCSVKGAGQSVFSISVGITAGIEGNYSGASSTVIDMYFSTGTAYSASENYKNIKKGMAHHAIFKGRYDFGGLIAAGKFAYYSAGADFYLNKNTAAGVGSQAFDAVAGVTFLPERFVIPLEIFTGALFQSEKGYASGREANYSLFTAGLRAGLEYKFSEGVLMRLGVDSAYGGPSSYVKTGSLVNDAMLGTSSNPAYLQTGISLGAGHYTGKLEINLNIRYSNTGRLPYKGGIKYGEGETTVISDVKVYL